MQGGQCEQQDNWCHEQISNSIGVAGRMRSNNRPLPLSLGNLPTVTTKFRNLGGGGGLGTGLLKGILKLLS